jgi:hypothetical protein
VLAVVVCTGSFFYAKLNYHVTQKLCSQPKHFSLTCIEKAKNLTEFSKLFGRMKKGFLASADSRFLIWHARMGPNLYLAVV